MFTGLCHPPNPTASTRWHLLTTTPCHHHHQQQPNAKITAMSAANPTKWHSNHNSTPDHQVIAITICGNWQISAAIEGSYICKLPLYPHSAARWCQLTPALLLWGFLVSFGGIPTYGFMYPQAFENPYLPLGAGTIFNRCGYSHGNCYIPLPPPPLHTSTPTTTTYLHPCYCYIPLPPPLYLRYRYRFEQVKVGNVLPNNYLGHSL